MPKIKDVAEAAGVSTATVSRVLADKPHVKPEIRTRVFAAVEQLNYRPNRVARSLRVQTSNTIGLIVADIQNPFFTAVSRAVEDSAYQQGLSVFLCNTDENPDKEAMYLNLLRDENVAGVIMAPTSPTAETFAKTVQLDVPVVVIDRRVRSADVDSVLVDNAESAYALIEHLFHDGYRRIGAIFSIDSATGRERHDGYLRAIKDYDLDSASELCLYTGPREKDGYTATLQLLQLSPPPDAIFASNGLISAGTFRAIRENGKRIPKDVALIGFDETRWATLVDPPLTVMQQPTYEIGKIATELLLKRIADPARPKREVILKTQLILRQSCGPHT